MKLLLPASLLFHLKQSHHQQISPRSWCSHTSFSMHIALKSRLLSALVNIELKILFNCGEHLGHRPRNHFDNFLSVASRLSSKLLFNRLSTSNIVTENKVDWSPNVSEHRARMSRTIKSWWDWKEARNQKKCMSHAWLLIEGHKRARKLRKQNAKKEKSFPYSSLRRN